MVSVLDRVKPLELGLPPIAPTPTATYVPDFVLVGEEARKLRCWPDLDRMSPPERARAAADLYQGKLVLPRWTIGAVARLCKANTAYTHRALCGQPLVPAFSRQPNDADLVALARRVGAERLWAAIEAIFN